MPYRADYIDLNLNPWLESALFPIRSAEAIQRSAK